jgi:hypothetical protein
MFELFTHDKNDKSLSNSKSRWFLQILLGIAPLVYAYYAYTKIPPPPLPEKPEVDLDEFSDKISLVTEKLMHPQVYYIPYPSTAQPVPEVPKASPKIAKAPKVPELPEVPEVK